jgi:hypothetical protein
MRNRLITILAVLMAIVGWWALYELTATVWPDEEGALPFFFALLFLAVTATLIPPSAFLNRRIAPRATQRDPWRFLRHSAWGGLCVVAWSWLLLQRILNPGFALVILLIFVVLEILIMRVRREASGAKGK